MYTHVKIDSRQLNTDLRKRTQNSKPNYVNGFIYA